MAIQMLLDGARRAVAAIFMNVKSAFYKILPELALGPLVGAEQRLALFSKLGMDSAAAAAPSEAILNGHTIMPSMIFARPLRIGIEGPGSRSAAASHAPSGKPGCGQGDPPADAVFALAFVAFQQLLDRLLEERGLRVTVAAAGDGIFRRPLAPTTAHLLGQMSYMDDVAILIEVAHCELLLPHRAAVAEVVLVAAKAIGLTANWAAGKTEAVVGLHGPGLAGARAELAALAVLQEDGRPVPLPPFPGGGRLRIDGT
jgi:hypothetical protein